jgi:hypothetical protein
LLQLRIHKRTSVTLWLEMVVFHFEWTVHRELKD